jgi:hypothetical protein
VSEVEKPSKSSDFVSLTREELGLILEAQDIIPFSSRKKENQDFIRVIGQYNKASWNCLRGNERFPFLLWTSLIVMISAFFFVPEFQDNILICIYYIFGAFYLLFLAVIPIYLLIKKKGFRIILRNFRKFLTNILYYMCSQIYVMISGIVLGYVYVSWTKDLYILISAAYEWRKFSEVILTSIISTTIILPCIWLVSTKKCLELTHKKWRSLSARTLVFIALPSFIVINSLVIHIAQYVENENLIAKGADSQNKLLEMQQLFWLKINFLSIGFCIILMCGIAVAYDFELSKKYQLKYGSLFKKALFKNQN